MSKPQWKTGDVYSEELANANEVSRKDTLESLAYSVEEGAYTRALTEAEIIDRKNRLSEVSIELAEIEERRKELMAEIKDEKSTPELVKFEMIQSIKHKSEFRHGTTYNIEDYDNGLMYVFDNDGVCVGVRSLRPGEKQTSILSIEKNGTDDE